jgi:hypothetical protein
MTNDTKRNDDHQTPQRKTDHAPDPYLYDLFARILPSPKSFWITDLDLVLRDRAGNFMIVEVKRRLADLTHNQRTTIAVVDKLIKAGVEATGGQVTANGHTMDVSFKGSHLLQFENTTAEDGRIFWDREEVTLEELARIMSFQ